MDRIIPTENWFVCWPCREYFKTRKCFENHKLTEHKGDSSYSSYNSPNSPHTKNTNKDSPTDLHSKYGYKNANFNSTSSGDDPDSDNLSDDSLEDGTVSGNEESTGKKKSRIVSVDWLVCRPCREYFKSAKTFEQHQLRIHGVTADIKEDCQSSWTPVEVNSMTILENGPIAKTYSTKLENVKIEVGEENWSPSSSSLDIKLPEIISGEETFPCSICSKRFRLRFQLNCHLRRHIGEKPFACSVCGKMFNQEDQLRTHREKHTRSKYKRQAKRKHIESSSNFKKLMGYATTSNKKGKTKVSCNICSKVFSTRKQLQRHRVLLHDVGKSFACKTCGRGFNFKHNLIRHEATHSGERPFECELCGKFFTQKHNVYRHMRQMHSINPITNEPITTVRMDHENLFDCNVCGKVFTIKHNMFRHQRRSHGV